jgi:DNA-directed RNA polymerase specialized sigma24 family protein
VVNDERVWLLAPLEMRVECRSEDTFVSFYYAEFRRVVRFLMKNGATLTEAQDATQEAMIQAWRRWGDLTRPGNSPGGWIRKVAFRAFVKTVPQRPSSHDDMPVAAGEVVVEMSERAQLVFRLLAMLPYMQRMVLAYSADGFNDRLIAVELDTTPVAVRKNRQRGREAMKKLLIGGSP